MVCYAINAGEVGGESVEDKRWEVGHEKFARRGESSSKEVKFARS